MKKLLSILLSVAVSMTAMTGLAFAEGETATQTGADYFPCWTIKDNTGGRTIERVCDDVKQSYMAKITSDGSSAQWNVLKYVVPQSFLTAGHTYTVNLDLKSEGFASDANCWVDIAMGGVNKQPKVTAITSWSTRADKGIDLNAGREISISLTQAAAGSLYVDNLKITDEQTGKVLVIENGDFEKVVSDYQSSADVSGWIRGNASDRCTVERVFDFNTNSWCAKITYDATKGGAAARTMLQYTVPQSFLTAGHTYTVNLYMRSEGFSGNNWGYLYLGNTKKEPFMGHITGGTTRNDTGIDLYSNNTIRFTLSHTVSGIVYLDNLKITDEQTGEVLNIENGDFEKVAADYTQVGNSVTMPEWTVRENANATVERVYNFTRGSWEAKLTSVGTGGSWNKLRYTIPRTMLVSDHTYTVSAYASSSGLSSSSAANQWLVLNCTNSGADQNKTYWGHHYKSGGTIKIENVKLYANNIITFGYTHAAQEEFFIDDIVITDETDGTVIYLPNADFETVLNESINFTSNNAGEAIAEIVSRDDSYDINLIWATYAVDEDGNEILDEVNFEKKTVLASDSVQTFTIAPMIKPGCVSKVFLWEDGTLKPLVETITFDAIESAE